MTWVLILIIGSTWTDIGHYRTMDACVDAGRQAHHAYICRLDEGEPV